MATKTTSTNVIKITYQKKDGRTDVNIVAFTTEEATAMFRVSHCEEIIKCEMVLRDVVTSITKI